FSGYRGKGGEGLYPETPEWQAPRLSGRLPSRAVLQGPDGRALALGGAVTLRHAMMLLAQAAYEADTAGRPAPRARGAPGARRRRGDSGCSGAPLAGGGDDPGPGGCLSRHRAVVDRAAPPHAVPLHGLPRPGRGTSRPAARRFRWPAPGGTLVRPLAERPAGD